MFYFWKFLSCGSFPPLKVNVFGDKNIFGLEKNDTPPRPSWKFQNSLEEFRVLLQPIDRVGTSFQNFENLKIEIFQNFCGIVSVRFLFFSCLAAWPPGLPGRLAACLAAWPLAAWPRSGSVLGFRVPFHRNSFQIGLHYPLIIFFWGKQGGGG